MQLIKCVIAVLLFIIILNFIFPKGDTTVYTPIQMPEGVSIQWNFTVQQHGNVCISHKLNFYITVELAEIVDEEKEVGGYNITGQWNPQTYTITLEDPSLEVIAHEVHHMVDTVMRDKQILDHHMAAYMQGRFTECVYNIARNRLINGTE